MPQFKYFALFMFAAIAGLIIMIQATQPLVVLEDSEVRHVIFVISGSEFAIETGDTVKLIGVEHPPWPSKGYTQAHLRMIDLVLDKDIVLERDVVDRDINDKMLRHAFAHNIYVNEEMVKKGFVKFAPMVPNIKYMSVLKFAQEEAKKKRLGVWS